MISVLLFFFLAGAVFAASSGKNSPRPADEILLGSMVVPFKIIFVTDVARITLKSQLSFISPLPFIGWSSVCPSTMMLISAFCSRTFANFLMASTHFASTFVIPEAKSKLSSIDT